MNEIGLRVRLVDKSPEKMEKWIENLKNRKKSNNFGQMK